MEYIQNFHIIDNKAYTEDNVLVYNVFVCNILGTTTRHRIESYFQQFGRISEVGLLPLHQSNKKYRHAFVNFSKPEDAATVLREPLHNIGRELLRTFACNSWHQPDVKELLSNASGNCADHKLSLLRLNDNCLVHIFSFLDINNQVNLALCDLRLRNILEIKARRDFKVLKLEIVRLLTLWQTRFFLEVAGPYIVQIEGVVPPKQVLKFIGVNCANLERVRFPDYGSWKCFLTSKSLFVLLRNKTMLTDLELNNVHLRDNDVAVIGQLCNIKKLSLANNYDLSGRYIKTLQRLEVLILNNCHRLEPQYFKEICEHVKSLKALDIEKCNFLTSTDIRLMVDNLRCLENLTLSCDNIEVEHVALLPNLKYLHLSSSGTVPTRVFEIFAIHLKEKLEVLEVNVLDITPKIASSIGELRNLRGLLCPNCTDLDDECLDQIANLTNLRELNLKNCRKYHAKNLIDLITKCIHLNALNVVGCRQLTKKFYKWIFQLAHERMQDKGKTSKLLKVKASFTFNSDLSLDQFKFESEGLKPDQIFEYY